MTAIVTGCDGRRYIHRPAGMRPVFVADQPHQRHAHAAAHTGHALLIAWLDPVQLPGEPMARVRCADGRVLQVHAAHIRDATTIAARRIRPAGQHARRTA